MRSIFVGIIVLSASMAVVHTAQAQTQPQRPFNYGYVQTPVDRSYVPAPRKPVGHFANLPH